MRLTQYSDYALRSLMYLAIKPEPQNLVTISDIADRYHISKSHLTKIIQQLAQLGYVDSVRGKNGGIRLGLAPKDINLGKLIRQIEPDFQVVECFSTPSNCIISPVCRLKGVFFEALTAFIQVLDKYTLEDIIDNKDALMNVLF